MRIAFVTFEYPPFIIGGAGVYAKHVTEELAKRGHEVVVFTPDINNTNSNKQTPNASIQINHVPVRKSMPFKALQFWIHLPGEIQRAERAHKFDIIHINGLSYWFSKRRLSATPHVLTVHHLVRDAAEDTDLGLFARIKDISGENGFLIPLIEKRAINYVDKIIAVSKYTKDRILQTYQTPSEKIDVIYNGVDSSGYTFMQQDLAETKKQLGLSGFPIILFVGRVDDPRKGLDVLIQAFRKVLNEVNATLLVVGKGDQSAVRNLAGPALGRIVFTGFVDEITLKKCYALCDVYVCPSRLEGFGLTILEAFAAGKPVVATSVGALKELIQPGINGLLVEKSDISGMADAIISSLLDPAYSDMSRERNYRSINNTFSWIKNTRDVENLYQRT